MEKEKLFDQIESFLNNDLRGEDLKNFEDKMTGDESFAQEVRLHKKIHAELEDAEMMDLKSQMNSMRAEYLKKSWEEESEVKALNPKSRVIGIRFLMTAVAAIAVLTAAYFLFQQETLTGEEIFAQNYVQPSPVGTDREEGKPILNENFDEAFKAYVLGNFGKASDSFIQILNEEPENHAASFYLGISQLEVGNLSSAAQVLKNTGGLYAKDAQWFLALIYLKQNDRDKAKPILESLHNSKYRERAKELLGN